jgi:hypothetical protein
VLTVYTIVLLAAYCISYSHLLPKPSLGSLHRFENCQSTVSITEIGSLSEETKLSTSRREQHTRAAACQLLRAVSMQGI